MITSYSHETIDLLNIVSTKYYRELEKYPILEKYVHRFLSSELMRLNQDETSQEMLNFFAFQPTTEHHSIHLNRFFKMIVQHNLRVISGYYS
jgi:hypothetical protein